MPAIRKLEGPEWVVHGRTLPGAGRPLYHSHQPFKPGWPVCVIHRPFGPIAPMPATGQERPLGDAVRISQNRSFE